MKQTLYRIICIIAILALIIISGCAQQTKTSAGPATTKPGICEALTDDFDAYIGQVDTTVCDRWETEGKEPNLVGGKIVNISKVYNEAYTRNEFTLTIKGSSKLGQIYIGTQGSSIPYEVGRFYRFDLTNLCPLMRSAASSGMFYDPSLDALEHMHECDLNSSI
jgi:hypothetical protein